MASLDAVIKALTSRGWRILPHCGPLDADILASDFGDLVVVAVLPRGENLTPGRRAELRKAGMSGCVPGPGVGTAYRQPCPGRCCDPGRRVPYGGHWQ